MDGEYVPVEGGSARHGVDEGSADAVCFSVMVGDYNCLVVEEVVRMCWPIQREGGMP